MAEPWKYGEQDGRSVDSVSCRPQGEPCPLKCWYSFEMALVADAEGLNAHRRQYETIRMGKDRKVRRSPQAVACRKRDVEELGRPHTFLPGENDDVWYTALEAHKGKPGHGAMLEPGHRCGPGVRQAAQNWEQERPPYAYGESYRA